MGNQALLITLLIVYIIVGLFSSLFIPDFSFGFLGSILSNPSTVSDIAGGTPPTSIISLGLGFFDFIITFFLLPFQAVLDPALNITGGIVLRIIFAFMGLLNNLVVAFYIRGFI